MIFIDFRLEIVIMDHSDFQVAVRLILLGSIFHSCIPTYASAARFDISTHDDQSEEDELFVIVLKEIPLNEFPADESFELLFN
jgi:hypothetical protein